eukprot:4185228-Pyramimonas_sp.AAC.1
MASALQADKCILFVCDIQDKFAHRIENFASVLHVASIMIRGANALSIPVVVTEQYPERFGVTARELTALLKPSCKAIPKTSFSMVTSEVAEVLANHPVGYLLFGCLYRPPYRVWASPSILPPTNCLRTVF